MCPPLEDNPNEINKDQAQTSQQQHSDSTSNQHKASTHPKSIFTIKPVQTPSDLEATIDLFTAYVKSLGIDLSFQDFQAEMTSMPGKYSPSAGGQLLLARVTSTDTSTSTFPTNDQSNKPKATTPNPEPNPGTALGCVALRALPTHPTQAICEMKRLYVTPAARGLGLGRALALEIIATARSLGYDEMRMDTLPTMAAAQAMYRDFGFVDIEPYCFNPVEGTRFLALKLR